MLSVEKTTPKSVKLFITCQYLLSFPATMWHLCSSEGKMGLAFYLWVLVDLSFVSLSSLVGKFLLCIWRDVLCDCWLFYVTKYDFIL